MNSFRALAEIESKLEPLEVAVGRAWWDANASGQDADFQKKELAQNKLDAFLSERTTFESLKAMYEARRDDEKTAREITVLYLQFLEKQLSTELLAEMSKISNAVEQKFNVFRIRVGEKSYTDSEMRALLKTSRDSNERKAVYLASKEIGSDVDADLRRLARLRNEAAKKLGFANFHVMALFLAEQEQSEVTHLFDELDEVTRPLFNDAKKEIDARLAKKFNIAPGDLMPWHYSDPFFQDPPPVYSVDFDDIYAGVDVLEICRKFYDGIGLPVDAVLKRSDLFERDGKSPHAFCVDLDRDGDVRVLANIVPNERWMGTMLHELGHAVYSTPYIPETLPYVLRTPSHIFTTEAIAMLFGAFSKSALWMKQMGIPVPSKEAAAVGAEMRRHERLIFSRWAQVMYRFEKALYENPEGDLNTVWWDLVERFQGLKRPPARANAADYGAKIHVVSAPAYYHNYLLGELFASQLHATAAREVEKTEKPAESVFVGNPAIGEFFQSRVFAPGRALDWRELCLQSTGKPLSAEAFTEAIRAPA